MCVRVCRVQVRQIYVIEIIILSINSEFHFLFLFAKANKRKTTSTIIIHPFLDDDRILK